MKDQEKIDKSIEMLESIRKQWNEKKLDDMFFILPYELNEFICELQN